MLVFILISTKVVIVLCVLHPLNFISNLCYIKYVTLIEAV